MGLTVIILGADMFVEQIGAAAEEVGLTPPGPLSDTRADCYGAAGEVQQRALDQR
ncbi:MAG: hypothetical protein ABSB83_03980 [Methanomassiliicoccales archaeon]